MPARQAEDGNFSALQVARDVVHAGWTKDHAVARVAERQHGLVTRAQLLQLGLGKGAIDHRVAHSRLHRVHRGVYRVGHTAPVPLAHEMAAVLACGDQAVLSHWPAARVFGLAPSAAGRFELDVTVPPGGGRRRPGIRIHRCSLAPQDVGRIEGIPVTKPARTLLDLAGEAPLLVLERALEDAQRRGLVTRRAVLAALERSPKRRGSAALRALLRRQQGPALTRSAAEGRLLKLVRDARLPAPEHNLRIGRHEIDAIWRDAHLAVEVDGFAFHSSRAAFERDRRRDAELAAAGWHVIRVTWRQLVEEPEAVVARLAAALAARPPRSPRGPG